MWFYSYTMKLCARNRERRWHHKSYNHGLLLLQTVFVLFPSCVLFADLFVNKNRRDGVDWAYEIAANRKVIAWNWYSIWKHRKISYIHMRESCINITSFRCYDFMCNKNSIIFIFIFCFDFQDHSTEPNTLLLLFVLFPSSAWFVSCASCTQTDLVLFLLHSFIFVALNFR